MSNKNLTIGLLITLVIAIIAIFTPIGQKAEQSFGNVVNGNWTGFNGIWVQTSTNQIRYGSSSSNDAGTNVQSIQRVAITPGTTTPCSILSPSATSSLGRFSILPTVGTTTAGSLIISTSTAPYSTAAGVVYGGLITYVPMNSFTGMATTTNSANIPPSTYLNFGLTAATASGGFVMTGYCTADFLTE